MAGKSVAALRAVGNVGHASGPVPRRIASPLRTTSDGRRSASPPVRGQQLARLRRVSHSPPPGTSLTSVDRRGGVAKLAQPSASPLRARLGAGHVAAVLAQPSASPPRARLGAGHAAAPLRESEEDGEQVSQAQTESKARKSNFSHQPVPLSLEAKEWLEENAERLAAQTEKCLFVHCQLQALLRGQQQSPRRRAAAFKAAATEVLPLTSLVEGAPQELLSQASEATPAHHADVERRDLLRSELVDSQLKVVRLRGELRALRSGRESFSKALDLGSHAELQRCKQQSSVLQARLADRLDTLQQIATTSCNTFAPKASWSPPTNGGGGRCGSPGRSLSPIGSFPAAPAISVVRNVSSPVRTVRAPLLGQAYAEPAVATACRKGGTGLAMAASSRQKLDSAHRQPQIHSAAAWHGLSMP
eukprot:TRINITY_DN10723_c0_g1_i1.p1 TRINITY_DN10723_c0_g1~~TRINITY_DN10723_c0_g1_i1.p1  ORF type:complete len:417 (+),score=50.31 TRINITY_DN10723_c0_g1_i1:65-1315(+)